MLYVDVKYWILTSCYFLQLNALCDKIFMWNLKEMLSVVYKMKQKRKEKLPVPVKSKSRNKTDNSAVLS